MPDLFHSPRLTFIRAKHHVADFNRIEAEFVNSNPWSHFVDKQSQPGQDLYKIQFTEPLPIMLPCIVFDAVNNLRAVLDQAGYAAAVASGKISPKKTNFPFADTLDEFNAHVDGRRKPCEHLPPEILSIFRGFNPYKGGNDTLWALNKLCNTKKHCALIPLAINNASATFYAEIDHGGSKSYVTSPASTGIGWDPAKREMTLMSMPPGNYFEIRGKFSFSIAIDGIEVFRDRPAELVFNAMCDEVERVLVATEAECRRLGFQLGH